MEKKNFNRIFRLKIQMTTAVFVLIAVLVSSFFIFGPELSQVAKALSGNYNRTAAQNQLTRDDWNLLDADFVAKSGGVDAVMTGPLTLPGLPTAPNHAATKQYVDSQMSIFDVATGNELRMVCGQMPLNAVNTIKPYDYTLNITVDTSSAGFGSVLFYISSLDGDGNHYRASGVNTIYDPDNNSYEIWLQYWDPFIPGYNITVADVISWRWTVNWCALGN